MDLRCESGRKHAELIEPGVIEVKCTDRYCGATKGVIVLHRFNASTGDLIETKRYRNPQRRIANAAHNASPAVRSA